MENLLIYGKLLELVETRGYTLRIRSRKGIMSVKCFKDKKLIYEFEYYPEDRLNDEELRNVLHHVLVYSKLEELAETHEV